MVDCKIVKGVEMVAGDYSPHILHGNEFFESVNRLQDHLSGLHQLFYKSSCLRVYEFHLNPAGKLFVQIVTLARF